MKRLAMIFFAGSLLGLSLLSVGAQNAVPFGRLPMWFESLPSGAFVAHGRSSEFFVEAGATHFTLQKNTGETASGSLRFVGASPAANLAGQNLLPGKVNYIHGSQPDQWQTDRPMFAQLHAAEIYPGVAVTYYGNQEKLEYDLTLAAGANPGVITLRFDGAEKIYNNERGELVVHFSTGDLVQHAPVAYQLAAGLRQPVAASYKILDAHTTAFNLGNYDHSAALVIDPVLEYSTYYGGNLGDTAWAIAVNQADGSIYVAGQTFSKKTTNGIPFWTTNALQTNYLGGKLTGDAFVARFDNTGTNLIYATYIGGTGNDGALGLALDAAGDAYLAGYTDSTNFPTTNAIYSHIAGVKDKFANNYLTDAFVLELNPAGSQLIYSTYLGGSSMDAAYGIAVDESGNAYVTGYTYSSNFPVTPDAFQTKLACSNTVYTYANSFISEIAAGGTNLNYSTYFGGTNYDMGRAVAYNNNRLFVAGYTYSTNFPVTNALPKLTLVQTNYYTKKSGTVIVTNVWTNYTDGMYLNGSTNKKNGYASDAFVLAFDTSWVTNLHLIYSTYLGGTNDDRATAITADAAGNCYVAGYTCSTNFPDTVPDVASSFVNTNGVRKFPATNGFLTKIALTGSQPRLDVAGGYSVMFGGKGMDVANGVAIDAAGNAYVVGSASSTNFPVTTNYTSGFLSATNNTKKNKKYSDVFVIVFNADCTTNLFSSYLGGDRDDYGNAIALDASNNVYLTGQTLSTNFPAVNAYAYTRQGTNDMFIAKISMADAVPKVLTHFLYSPTPPAAPAPALVITTQSAVPVIRSKVAGALSPPASHVVTLKWVASTNAQFDVEYSADLSTSQWTTLPQTPAYTNGCYQLDMPMTNDVQFFRLRQR
jgi:Beta-propeller repeat